MPDNKSSTMVITTLELVVTRHIIVVILCIFINYINGILVHSFFSHEMLRENPRYILFIHLVFSDMIQLTISALLHVLIYVFFKINTSVCCFLLMIAIFTTFNTPLNLAGMAIERYIAVCNPLRYSQICTVSRTYIFIGVTWAMAASSIMPDLFVLLVTESNQFFHSTIFCSRDYVFHHAFMKEKRNISHAICLALVSLILVFSYFKILFAAKAVNTEAKKARNTILLHAAQLCLCMLTYIGPPLQTMLIYIAPTKIREIEFALYLIVHILPRFLSPILYGLRDQSFRKYFMRYFLCKVMMTSVKQNTNPRVGP